MVLIALVPGHCLSFTFSVRTLNAGGGGNSNEVYFFSTVTFRVRNVTPWIVSIMSRSGNEIKRLVYRRCIRISEC